MPTDAIDNPAIRPLLSARRLATYEAACGSNTAEAMRLYAWNIEASAATWGGFAVLEVCLRNAISAQLATYTGRTDWWNSPLVTLRAQQQGAINAATGPSATPDSVVASLTFGFWTSLLANRYHQQLWVPAINGAFPGYRGRRGVLQQRLEALRRLRNRLAHHEPVFRRNLAADHRIILDVLGWLEPAARAWVERDSRLTAVLAARADTVNATRKTSF